MGEKSPRKKEKKKKKTEKKSPVPAPRFDTGKNPQ
jgi:hypothetical protein